MKEVSEPAKITQYFQGRLKDEHNIGGNMCCLQAPIEVNVHFLSQSLKVLIKKKSELYFLEFGKKRLILAYYFVAVLSSFCDLAHANFEEHGEHSFNMTILIMY